MQLRKIINFQFTFLKKLLGGRNVYFPGNNKLRTRGDRTGNTAIQHMDDTFHVFMAGRAVHVPDPRCGTALLDTETGGVSTNLDLFDGGNSGQWC
jgi:hypothetical protein